MRLRKTMKRTAAAVLALSMAVSAVAAPASAAYICDVSQGNVVVSVNEKGEKSIKVGDVDVKKSEDDSDDIIITGDNTKPAATESLNAAKENADEAENAGENTSEVEKSGENSSEVEKSGETKTEGKDKTQNSAAEGDEPTTQELLAPEDEQKKTEEQKDEQKPAETQETEQDKKPTDQVLLCGQNDPEANKEATKQETKEKSYGDTPAPTTLSESVQAAANNVVKIINNSTEPLKVFLRNLKVDAGNTAENAVTVSGTGDVTLELDGKNELTGGSGYSEENYGSSASGIRMSGDGKHTIQGKEGSSLSATGGSGNDKGGYGIYASQLELVDATVTATGGAGGGAGMYTHWKDFNIKNSKLTARGGGQLTPGDDASKGGGCGIYTTTNVIVGEDSEVIAIGGSDKATDRAAQGGWALGYWQGSYQVKEGGKLTAIGGNAESKNGEATGGDALWGAYMNDTVFSGETTLIAGNAKSGSGKATGGDTIKDGGYGMNVTVNGGTTTVVGGKAESATGPATNGDGITGILGIGNQGGKIEEAENAKVDKKEDGTVEVVVGDVVSVVTGDHKYKLTATEQPTCTTPGKRVYTCTTWGHTDDTYEETIDALGHEFVNGVCTRCGAPEQAAAGGGSSAVTLTVTGAGAYEASIADGRYTVAVPAETAVLSGCLSNLKELKAQGADTIVFRTQLRETALNIDSMLSLGVDDTLFTLTHNGEGASLTIGGFEHNELIH